MMPDIIPAGPPKIRPAQRGASSRTFATVPRNEDGMAGSHHRLEAHEFGSPGVGDGQGGLACCFSWGRKELDMTERLN